MTGQRLSIYPTYSYKSVQPTHPLYHLGAVVEKLRYSLSSLILLLNFGLGRGLKFKILVRT